MTGQFFVAHHKIAQVQDDFKVFSGGVLAVSARFVDRREQFFLCAPPMQAWANKLNYISPRHKLLWATVRKFLDFIIFQPFFNQQVFLSSPLRRVRRLWKTFLVECECLYFTHGDLSRKPPEPRDSGGDLILETALSNSVGVFVFHLDAVPRDVGVERFGC